MDEDMGFHNCPTCKGGTFSPHTDFSPKDCPECDGEGVIEEKSP